MNKLIGLALLLGLTGLTACGDDDATIIDAPTDAAPIDCVCGDTPTIDSTLPDAVVPDAPPSSVTVVPCPANVASTVTAPGFAYDITQRVISPGSIVRFQMPSSHNAVSGAVNGGIATPDGRFTVNFSQTVCLQFSAPGNFPFYCGPHLFTGSLTVAPPA